MNIHNFFNFRRNWLFKPALIAAFITASMGGIQLLIIRANKFLGVETQTINEGLISLYPWSARVEFAAIFTYVFLFFYAIFLLTQVAKSNIKHKALKPWHKSLILYTTLLIAYFSFTLSSIIEHPALYENFLTFKAQQFVFTLAAYLNPNYLAYFSLFTLSPVLLVAYYIITRKHKYFHLLLSLTLLAAWVSNIRTKSRKESSTTNILLISVDSLRSDRSFKKNFTPNLLALKDDKQSILFTEHHIGIPRTFPSWIEILSGNYSARSGIRHMFPSIGRKRIKSPDLASVLNENQYSTAVYSDFAGDIFPRFNNGFKLIKTPNLNIPTLIKLGIEQSFPLFLPFISSWPGNLLFTNLSESPSFADPNKLVDKFLDGLNKNNNQNFFTSIFFSTAHFPYAAPWPWYKHFSETNYKGSYFFQKNPKLQDHFKNVSKADKNQVHALYNGSVLAIDHSIGKIIKQLKDRGLYDKTHIIVTADHGEDLYESGLSHGHGEHLKGEQVIKVPFLIKLAKTKKPATNIFSFISRSIDIMPTILGLVDIQIPRQVKDGVDLSPWILGKKTTNPDLAAYSETGIWFSSQGEAHFQKTRIKYPGITNLLQFDPGHSGDIILKSQYENIIITAKHRSYIKGDYKLIYTPTHEQAILSLYNRAKDPENNHEISSAQPLIFNKMKNQFFNLINSIENNHRIIDDYAVVK